MKRQLPAVATGSLLALLAILALLWLATPVPSDADQADVLAAELRCPDCQGLSVADSQTASAREIRRQIADMVDSGANGAEVRAHFINRYGEWILLAPTSPAAWVLPFIALGLGIAALASWLIRRRPAPEDRATVDDETRRRLHEEADALDA
jgi:cytochrome c-type biogenesis protein CcmH